MKKTDTMTSPSNQARRKLVILAGAGASAENGISTFRDSDGLWENYPAQDIASIEGFVRNPQLVLDFYNARRRDYVGCEPNMTHYGLAKLECQYDMTVVTRNVDNLHECTGSSKVIHLHGELVKDCSVRDTQKTYPVDPKHLDLYVGDLASDGPQPRLFAVWLGEVVPMIEPTIRGTSQADIMVAVGTPLNVYPAASPLAYVPSGIPIYLIDSKKVNTHGIAYVTHIQKVAMQGVKELLDILMPQS